METTASPLTERSRGVRDRLTRVLTEREIAEGVVAEMSASLKTTRDRRDEIVRRLDLEQSARAVVERLVELVTERDVGEMKRLIDWGLAIVFPDRGYEILITVDTSRGNQTMRFDLREKIHGEDVCSDVREDIGGGVRAVIGLLIQVFYVRWLDLPRVIAQDEGLTAVSSDYLGNLYELMTAFRDRMGFKFLFVAHDPRIRAWADQTYVVSGGEYRLEKGGRLS
jgi:ABC-type glutathione transport system ATPase component